MTTTVETHGAEMQENLSAMTAALETLADTRQNAETASIRWASRVREIESIRDAGWRVHPGIDPVSSGDQKALESLMTVAEQRRDDYAARASQAEALHSELTRRVEQMNESKDQLAAHELLIASGLISSSYNEGIGQIFDVIKQGKQSIYKAKAFIEIEAGIH